MSVQLGFSTIIRTGDTVNVTGKYVLLSHKKDGIVCTPLPSEQFCTLVRGTKIDKITSCGHDAEYGLISEL